jgi:hypothetical protein
MIRRLRRWWNTRPWRGYRANGLDRLDARELLDSWGDLDDPGKAPAVALVMFAVRSDGKVSTVNFAAQDELREAYYATAMAALAVAGLNGAIRAASGGDSDGEVN